MQSSPSLPSLPPYSPALSRSRGHVEHSFQTRESGRSWLKLVLRSRAAKPEQTPHIVEGDPITGHVEITLEKAMQVTEISIVIQGRTNACLVGGAYRSTSKFLSMSKVLCRSSDAEPQKATFSQRLGLDAGSQIVGSHQFPFTIALPRVSTISNPPSDDHRRLSLSSSFAEQGAPYGVAYEIIARARRGRLHSDLGLAVDFVYFPIIRPPPFSALRQAVYEQGHSRLPGPHVDPDGWTQVRTVTINGHLFGDRYVEVACTLWLAKPLSYARGTFITCALTFSSSDAQALDVLSSLSAPHCKLVCHLSKTPAHRTDAKLNQPSGWDHDDQTTITRPVQRAVWWHPGESSRENERSNMRTLQGEIHLSTKLKPAFVLPQLRLSYKVSLFPFCAPGFAAGPYSPSGIYHNADQPLISQAVEIATVANTSAFPVTPPNYEREGTWPNMPKK